MRITNKDFCGRAVIREEMRTAVECASMMFGSNGQLFDIEIEGDGVVGCVKSTSVNATGCA